MKKFVISLIALFVCIELCALLFACDKAPSDTPEQAEKQNEHIYGEWIEEIPATCSTEGALGHYVCSDCGKYFDSEKKEILSITEAKKPHDMGDWEHNSTGCTDTRQETRKCKNCVYTESREAEATHSYTAWTREIPSTCTREGTLGYYECYVCGKYFDAEKKELSSIVEDKKSHDMGEWDQSSAGCTGTGQETRQCKSCTYTETREVQVTHNYSSWIKAIPATCEENGTLGHYLCSDCGKYFDAEKKELSSIVEKKKGHRFVDGICSCGLMSGPSEGLEFTDKGDYYAVSGIGDCTDTIVIIPSVYNGKPVKEIGYKAFCLCEDVETVIISEGVTSIGMLAFGECLNLKKIVIPEGVTAINAAAFFSCTKLESVVLPKSLTSIGDEAFVECTGLKSITITNGAASMGDYVFSNCTSLKEVNLPDGLTSISRYAFFNCTNLESIALPDGVTKIGEYAFSECTSLRNITLPNSLTEISIFAFQNCISLEEIALPNNLTYIGQNAFNNCQSITSIVIPESMTVIGNSAFAHVTNLTSVTFPSTLTFIGDASFFACENLKNIDIPEGVTYIGRMAFSGCSSLASITIPESVNFIGLRAFYGCSNLSSVTFEKTSTWMLYSDSKNEFLEELDPSLLQDGKNAAYLLSERIYGSNWKRK